MNNFCFCKCIRFCTLNVLSYINYGYVVEFYINNVIPIDKNHVSRIPKPMSEVLSAAGLIIYRTHHHEQGPSSPR